MKNNNEILLSKTFTVALIALVCSLLWGSAFSGVKIGYEKLSIESSDWASQMVFAGIRFSLAGIMALTFGSIKEKKLLLPSKKNVPNILVISLFQTILQYFFYYIGLAHTTGVKAAIIVAANVFIAIFISAMIFKTEKLTAPKIIGSIVGFAGIIVINIDGLKGGFNLNFLGDGFIFLCTVASGFSSVFMKKYSSNVNPVLLSGWQFFIGGAVMWIFGMICDGTLKINSIGSLLIIVYLSFVSAAAYSLWAILLKHNPVSKVAVWGFLNPICGVIISGFVLHETNSFGLYGAVALLLVCLGIYMVNKKKVER